MKCGKIFGMEIIYGFDTNGDKKICGKTLNGIAINDDQNDSKQM